jgi:hypothetical protein
MTKETKQDKAQALSKAIHVPGPGPGPGLDEGKQTLPSFHA